MRSQTRDCLASSESRRAERAAAHKAQSMLAELLGTLAGHPSALYELGPSKSRSAVALAPALTTHLHPGEVASLEALGLLAQRYVKVTSWIDLTLATARQAVLRNVAGHKGKEREAHGDEQEDPGVYLATVASTVQEALKEYLDLIIRTESRVISHDSALVQNDQGFVPLSSLVAVFAHWQAPMAALEDLVITLCSPPPSHGYDSWTPGMVIDLVAERAQTGYSHIASIFTSIDTALYSLWLSHLTSFLLFGAALSPSKLSPSSPSLALDMGPDPLSPRHRSYELNPTMIPVDISHRTRESILYTGRVAATLQREGRQLPKLLVAGLREEVLGCSKGDLAKIIDRARLEIGEWLWANVLTGPQVASTLEAFGDYFLCRNGEYSTSLIRELERLKLSKLINANPHSSSSVIREQDLNLALLRASVGTGAETDSSLERLRFKMPRGPLRPYLPSVSGNTPRKTTKEDLFSSSLLGTPVQLQFAIGWPLDLFMTPSAVTAYSSIFAYLSALRRTHVRVLDCWSSLSGAQRRRRKWTGGGEDDKDRKELARKSWGIVRAMLFFLDQLQSHFMTDIIDVQYRRMLSQLNMMPAAPSPTASTFPTSQYAPSTRGVSTPGPNRQRMPIPSQLRPGSPGSQSHLVRTPVTRVGSPGSTHHDAATTRSRGSILASGQASTFVDFLTLRQMHTSYLSFLREGLLLSDPECSLIVRNILETCERFVGLVERWGGDVLPELLLEGTSGEREGELVQERSDTVHEINETLHSLLDEFFASLIESQAPPAPQGDTSSSKAASTSFSQTARTFQQLQSTKLANVTQRIASRALKAVGTNKKDEKEVLAEASMSRHIEQLLLRLDFNEYYTRRKAAEEELELEA